ncbi:MAG: LuxR C-terminal-related transcriptional regulator [Thermomicrobiaceae bacterium]
MLATKLHIPQPQPRTIARPRLIELLNQRMNSRLTLLSAPAGFGKTTLALEWVRSCGKPVAWLSLDSGDSNPTRFLAHLLAAVQTVAPEVGTGLTRTLQTPQPPSSESILTVLLNEISELDHDFVLVLDDYHAVDDRPVDEALDFLITHLPAQLHLVITTREDPHLPLARLRARGQLSEIRAADLRFTEAEASEFLNHSMGLNLTADDISALEYRTEGWIAGLQLAAISMQGHQDATAFIRSFTGSHRFVLDYLVEEVLQQQSNDVQSFLLNTSVLSRMCGPLCDALLPDRSGSGQETLEYLEHSNLFIVPLDNERRWYRYHHLFAELLRQRSQQPPSSGSSENAIPANELHIRASEWFESQGLEIEAFHHAAAANDIERAERLANGKGSPLYVRGGVAPVLRWLQALPVSEMNARPSLWVMFATALAIVGHLSQVEPTVRAAEAAMKDQLPENVNLELSGRIDNLRALFGVLIGSPDEVESIISQSRYDLEPSTTQRLAGHESALWRLGLAYQRRGDRTEAMRAHSAAVSASEASGNIHVTILAMSCIGVLQEFGNQLDPAEKTFRRVLELVGDPPGPVACEAFSGLARISRERNDLDTAEQYGLLSVRLARQLELPSFVTSELVVARLKITRHDTQGAIDLLMQTEHDAQKHGYLFRLAEIVAVQVLAFLNQGDLAAAERLVKSHQIPLSQARVHLARGETSAALSILQEYRRNVEDRGWKDERLRTLVLQAVAHQSHGHVNEAMDLLQDALSVAEPPGLIRTFIDEGEPMARLISEAAALGIMPRYTGKLSTAFEAEVKSIVTPPETISPRQNQSLIDSLSQRELEVLKLITQGLSNNEISDRLYLALSTVKGHNRVIFRKLDVQRRTEAVARARELGLV